MDFRRFCLQEQKEALQESERRIMEVERERQREVELSERRAEELKFLTEREEWIRREKEVQEAEGGIPQVQQELGSACVSAGVRPEGDVSGVRAGGGASGSPGVKVQL